MSIGLVLPVGWDPGSCRVVATTRHGGVSRAPFAALNLGDHVGDDPAAVAENRRRLAAAIGCARIQWLRQVHGRTCVRATAATIGTVPEADAAWTDEADLALAVLTADCVPVVLTAPRAGIVAVAHAGWRGLVGGVLETLVAALPVAPAALEAWLGPAIGPVDYQVDTRLAAAIAGLDGGEALVGRVLAADPAPGHFRLDLYELATALLERIGVGEIASERFSTWADPRFYSHRRVAPAGGQTGRFATLAWRPSASA